MERLEILISSVSHLKNHIEDGLTRVEQENRQIMHRYVGNMVELVLYLQSLSQAFQCKGEDLRAHEIPCGSIPIYRQRAATFSNFKRPAGLSAYCYLQ